MTRDQEIAWAAGLFEGEGSIHANTIKGRIYLLLNLSSTDRDVVEQFARIMGCGKVYGPYYERNPERPRYSWHAKNKADSAQAVALLEPFLCDRRRAKLAEVRARVAEQRPPMRGQGIPMSAEAKEHLSQLQKALWERRRTGIAWR